jgi:hypothetical protein
VEKARTALLVGMATTVGWLGPACGEKADSGSSDGARPSGGSAGAAGVVEAVPLGGAGVNGGSAAGSGAGGSAELCAATPPGELALIDDFDDGDSVAVFEANREAYWFTVTDGTDGVLDPPNAFLPVEGGYRGTMSAHVTASGFTEWGAELSANISHETAVRCPYNASAFAGVRFVARGRGRLRVQVAMPEVVEKQYGGQCDPELGQTCYDIHGAFVELTDDYRVYELPWSSLRQRGFGEVVVFQPKTIMTLHFAMETAQLPVELWLDDVAFWDGNESGGAGGEGGGGVGGSGAGGEGQGGEASEGGASGGVGGAQ